MGRAGAGPLPGGTMRRVAGQVRPENHRVWPWRAMGIPVSAMRQVLVRLIVATIAITAIIVAAVIWRLPFGVGEYRESPDGQWTASLDSLNRGTFVGRERYLSLTVRCMKADRPAIRRVVPCEDGDVVPDYGDRSKSHIVWAPDLRQVTFTIANGQCVVVSVWEGTNAEPGKATEPRSRS